MQLAWLFFLMTIPGDDFSKSPEATPTAKSSYFYRFDKSINQYKRYTESLKEFDKPPAVKLTENQISRSEPPKITFSGLKEKRSKLASDNRANKKVEKEKDIPSQDGRDWTMIFDLPITQI